MYTSMVVRLYEHIFTCFDHDLNVNHVVISVYPNQALRAQARLLTRREDSWSIAASILGKYSRSKGNAKTRILRRPPG
jgi:hypothetical protein